jgi:general secretion pathway protein C
MNTNYFNLIKYLISIIITISIAYFINSILYFILPKYNINQQPSTHNALEYRKFYIKESFKLPKQNKLYKHKVTKQEYKFLSNIILKAIYSTGKEAGWIIVQDETTKTTIMSIDNTFKGYKLYKIFTTYVVFRKNLIEYKLSLINKKQQLQYKIQKTNFENKRIEEEISINGDNIEISRGYLNSYINDFDKIWKDIAINEHKDKNGKIDGFEIKKIKLNSVYSKLGLKKHDIIKSVNNIMLKNYNDAFGIYKKINNLENLNILILRDNTPMELNYEIK